MSICRYRIFIDGRCKEEPIYGHLKIGGKNTEGIEINANSQYLSKCGRPWLPIMGEFHFSRYSEMFW